MSYVITFRDFTPTPRTDNLPWTRVHIDEAPEKEGPWTQLEDLALVVDPDPRHPAARDFTTEKATLSAGWYRLTFVDATGDTQPADPLYHAARGPFLPSVADVGTHVRTRTRTISSGVELGTFTTDTRPTDDQVRRLIADADSKVAARFGSNLPEPLRAKVRVVNSLRAAMYVELGFFGDQIQAGRSPYNELKTLHDEEFKELVSDWKELGADGQPGSGDDLSDAGGVAIAYPAELAPHAPGSELAVPQTTSIAWREW